MVCRLYITPDNNHGCSGYDLNIEEITPTTGKIVGGSSCSSCWQVGCNNSEPIYPVGTIVSLPIGFNWEDASEGKANKIQLDISRSDETIVTPYQLDVIGQKCDDCGKIKPTNILYAVGGGKKWCLDCWPDAKLVCPMCGQIFAKQYDCAPSHCPNCGREVRN